jgi:hypothetical protein
MNVVIDGKQYVPASAKCSDPTLLDLRFECADIGRNVSVREYLHELLKTLWTEGEGFSGKRPFGNSGWEYDLYKPLILAGAVNGELDDAGYVDSIDESAASEIVFGLIAEMCGITQRGE